MWPTSAEKRDIVTLQAVCGGLQKIVRERHLFVLDEGTMGWVFSFVQCYPLVTVV